MTSRRTKQKRDAKYLETAKWVNVMSACLDFHKKEQDSSSYPIVDSELLADFSGSPENMFVWFICRTRVDKNIFRDIALREATTALKKRMSEGGFPEEAVSSLKTDVTSEEDIEEGGGRFSFFR
ncbi:MAG: hypothetical protein HYX71_00070 [Opitutae bacterium]|nr:hypothetical protein [Opitutae bacterium]